MHNSLWQTVLLAPLLVNAAPTINKRLARGAPDCAQLERKYGWDTDNAPWRPKDNPNDQFFCASQWNKNVTVLGISAWKGKDNSGSCGGKGPITNLQLRMSNHDSIEIGAGGKDCSAAAIGLDGGEIIDKIEIWPSANNPAAQGKTHIHTKSGKDGWLKDDYTPKQGDPWTQNAGSGILVAVTGYVLNGDVVQTNFHFLPSQIKQVIQGPIVYDQAALAAAPIELASANAGHQCNPNDVGQNFSAGATQGTFQTETTTHQDTSSFSSETAVKLGFNIPLLAEASVTQTFKFGHDQQNSQAVAHQNQVMATWATTTVIPPQSIMDCYMTTGKASLTGVPYTSSVKLIFEDGSSMEMPQTGTLDGTIYSGDYTGACKPRPIDVNSVADKKACHK